MAIKYSGGAVLPSEIDTEELRWNSNFGGTALVIYAPAKRKIVNILANFNPGGEHEFATWLSLKTGLDIHEIASNEFFNKATEQKPMNPEKYEKHEQRGQKTPPDNVKLAALVEWDNQKEKGEYLSDFVNRKFDGDVTTKTFQGWRGQLRKKGKYPPKSDK